MSLESELEWLEQRLALPPAVAQQQRDETTFFQRQMEALRAATLGNVRYLWDSLFQPRNLFLLFLIGNQYGQATSLAQSKATRTAASYMNKLNDIAQAANPLRRPKPSRESPDKSAGSYEQIGKMSNGNLLSTLGASAVALYTAKLAASGKLEFAEAATRTFLNRIAATEPFRVANRFIEEWATTHRDQFPATNVVLSPKACEICRSMQNSGLDPPFHPNCNCTVQPLTSLGAAVNRPEPEEWINNVGGRITIDADGNAVLRDERGRVSRVGQNFLNAMRRLPQWRKMGGDAWEESVEELLTRYFNQTSRRAPLTGVGGAMNLGLEELWFDLGGGREAKAILKRFPGGNAAMNEELTGMIARAIGAKTPSAVFIPEGWTLDDMRDAITGPHAEDRFAMFDPDVQWMRTGRREPPRVLMEMVQGMTASEWGYAQMRGRPGAYYSDVLRPFYESEDGKRLGLLDWLVVNNDRNDGNWMISSDGTTWGIDHEFAQFGSGYTQQSGSAFAQQWRRAQEGRSPPPLNLDELERIQRLLRDYRIEEAFDNARRRQDYEFVLNRLDNLIRAWRPSGP